MRAILAQLESILDRLAAPDRLTADEVGFLAREWDDTMTRLDHFPDSDTLPPGEKLYLRTWLQRLLQRLPAVQEQLLLHKSDIAKQLFSENRRFQALNNRYSAEFWGTGTMHQKA
ncbi:MAG: hypothetical protein H7838_00120 [Magnetococcus sp. DMHC-8]